MLRKLVVALAAVFSLGVASIPTNALAFGHGGGGGGHGGGFGAGGHGGFGAASVTAAFREEASAVAAWVAALVPV